ncbi:hypothetical protein D3C84_1144790 [compost metagenome]
MLSFKFDQSDFAIRIWMSPDCPPAAMEPAAELNESSRYVSAFVFAGLIALNVPLTVLVPTCA